MTPNTKRDFEILHITRQNILSTIELLTYDQMIVVPNGFSNSILWNVMHNLVTQQLLTYGLTGEKSNLDPEVIDDFRKGSAGNNVVAEEDFIRFKENYLSFVKLTENDFSKLKAKDFKVYTTSYNITLNSLEESIQFVNTHEGVHFGIIMAIKKLI